MALTKLTTDLIDGSLGTDWQTAIQTSNFTAEAGKGYFVDTTSQILYVNLPVGVVGMEITIQDYAGTFATNKVILNANGSEKIQGSTIEGRITTNNATAVLIYQDATKGWTSQDVTLNQTTISFATPTGQSLTYSTPSPQSSSGASGTTFPTTTFTATLAGSEISGTATIAGLPTGITAAQAITGSGAGNTLTVTLTGTFPSIDYINTALTLSGLSVVIVPISVDYLVVAGGAAGAGYVGGGGGAGGLRTSYGTTSGGGGSSEPALSLVGGTNYPLTVGGGGAGGGVAIQAPAGSYSNFSNITSTGGGGGGTGGGGPESSPQSGGSGGGGGSTIANYTGGAAVTTPVVQGYKGANSTNGQNTPNYPSGGGGGASQAGSHPLSSSISNASQIKGGDGLAVNILNTTNAATASVGVVSGSNVIYAGGGGGASLGYAGTGGSGGGGTGGVFNINGHCLTAGSDGIEKTGGGGGGGSQTVGTTSGFNNVNTSGGGGIIILRYPSTYSVTATAGVIQATGSPFTEGTDKVSVFTGGTGNIQFN